MDHVSVNMAGPMASRPRARPRALLSTGPRRAHAVAVAMRRTQRVGAQPTEPPGVHARHYTRPTSHALLSPRIWSGVAQSRPSTPDVAAGRSSPVRLTVRHPCSSSSVAVASTRTPWILPCVCIGRPTRLLTGIAAAAADRRLPRRRPSPEPVPAKPTPSCDRG
jgi:hypothetical protein